MPTNKLSHDLSRTALIREARAGLIPESDWIVEEARWRKKRTARTGRFVRSHAKLLARGSDAVAIKEILADLQHYCEGKSLAFDALGAEAREEYQEEISLGSAIYYLLQ